MDDSKQPTPKEQPVLSPHLISFWLRFATPLPEGDEDAPLKPREWQILAEELEVEPLWKIENTK